MSVIQLDPYEYLYQNTKLLNHANVSENIICEMAAICPGEDELIHNDTSSTS